MPHTHPLHQFSFLCYTNMYKCTYCMPNSIYHIARIYDKASAFSGEYSAVLFESKNEKNHFLLVIFFLFRVLLQRWSLFGWLEPLLLCVTGDMLFLVCGSSMIWSPQPLILSCFSFLHPNKTIQSSILLLFFYIFFLL